MRRLLIPVLLVLVGCGESQEPDALFRLLPASRTGISFRNEITETDTVNALEWEYLYNGGGVGVGDFNADGLPDLYFTGNQVSSRLYLNRGGLRFEDVTDEAGVATAAWATGVSVADVNADGLPDLYLSVSGLGDRSNLLFVNQGPGEDGVPTFTEKAQSYGLDDEGFTTHAAFFDYDGDGDLDVYVLNSTHDGRNPNLPHPKRVDGEDSSTDRLYRNDGDTFTDVSREAGILIEGYGLGVAINDFNADGLDDIYVANDYLSNDILYLNNGDGTFTNRIRDLMKHQSVSAMGADAADVNNDGLVDLVVLDMLPADPVRRQQMSGIMDYGGYHTSLRQGYEPQFMRNTLQLNYGPAPDGMPRFGEIAYLAGVEATDWSWAPLLADFDNDGRRDLFVTNGYRKDLTDKDFLQQRVEAAVRNDREGFLAAMRPVVEDLHGVKEPNFIFRNKGDLTFEDRTRSWGLGEESYSNGAAFADLDGDGDLDLVVNNIDQPAFVYENRLEEIVTEPYHYLRVRLEGPPKNRAGYGTRICLFSPAGRQMHRHSVYRGYQSSVDPYVHFGLGPEDRVDSLVAIWPDGRSHRMTDIPADQVLTLSYAQASSASDGRATSSTPQPSSNPQPTAARQDQPTDARQDELAAAREEAERARPGGACAPATRQPLFRTAAGEHGLEHRHIENRFVDFEYEPLLPHLYSRNGPALTAADVNGDGLDDLYVGGASGQAGRFFMQDASGRFHDQPLPGSEKTEDLDAELFDADGDGDLDLYVVSGGSEFPPGSPFYQDRLYRNDGRGGFTRDSLAIPRMPTSGGTVAAGDFDGDGDDDLFVGGRVVPGQYPYPARSYLLENRSEEGGDPRFVDVTRALFPEQRPEGMVTDALWSDFDGDGILDLIVVGEWMPVMFYKNRDGRFVDVTDETGLKNTSGWWRSLAAGDFDGDGDTDYVVGNLGLNSGLESSAREPLSVYAADFDRNRRLDAVLFRYVDGRHLPIPSRDEIGQQMPYMQVRFPTYRSYSEASLEDLFTEAERRDAYVRMAYTFESSYLENLGGGRFERRALPVEAQVSPAQALLVGDYDGDGLTDVLVAGNFYPTEVIIGRYDASVGLFLKGDGRGGFTAHHGTTSGFFVEGEGRAIERLETPNGPRVVIAQNDDSLRVFAFDASDRIANR